MKTKLVFLAMLFVSSFGFAKEKNLNAKVSENPKIKKEVVVDFLKNVKGLDVGLACCQTSVRTSAGPVFVQDCQEFDTDIQGAESSALATACANRDAMVKELNRLDPMNPNP